MQKWNPKLIPKNLLIDSFCDPFKRAVYNGNSDIVKLFLESPVNFEPKIECFGPKSILECAILYLDKSPGHKEVFDLLVENIEKKKLKLEVKVFDVAIQY